MKTYLKITLALILVITIVLGFALPLNMPPGWYQQTLPVNDFVNDIFFIDSSNGWVITQGRTTPPDTGHIMRTTNGGTNWNVQYSVTRDFNSMQMLDINTGYVGGGSGNGTRFVYKTTNGGANWNQILGSTGTGAKVLDMFFINTDTGWICDDNAFDGALLKTTNGGSSWTVQLTTSNRPRSVFFVNRDTGWVGTAETNGRLLRTTNGGINWNLQFTSNGPVESVFFLTKDKGWIRGGMAGGNGVAYTTNSGLNWINSAGDVAGFDIKFINDSIGYTGRQSFRIAKSKDGGKTWGYQDVPIGNAMSVAIIPNDTTKVWAGGSGLIKTTDGGGPLIYSAINILSTEVPSEFSLFQNFPNPFNPVTNIKYEIKETSNVKIIVYDIQGKEIAVIVNQRQNAGTYLADWNAEGFASGVYFYRIETAGFTDTNKMVLIK